MIKRNWTAAKENQSERQGRQGQWKLNSAIARETIVNMHFGDSGGHVDANRECRGAGEETDKNQQTSEELCKRREICRPAGQAETLHKLNMVMKSAENFVITVDDKNNAQGQAHNKKGKRLQTIEVAQVFPPCEKQTSLQHRAISQEV